MSDHSRASSGGIGVLGLLGIVFITLKLCHVIARSWIWVTAPFWGGIAFALLLLIIFLIVAIVGALLS
jgi:hypothetical protein